MADLYVDQSLQSQRQVQENERSVQGMENIYIPEKYDFKETQIGLPCLETATRLRTEQSTYSSKSNNVIQLDLPTSSLFDFRDAYWTFKVHVQGVGNGTYFRLNKYIFSIFNRLQILVNGREVENIYDWNKIYSMLMEIYNTSDVQEALQAVIGGGTTQQRNAQWMNGNVGVQPVGPIPQTNDISFACPMLSGYLNTVLMPLDVTQNSKIQLFLYLENPISIAMETDGNLDNAEIILSAVQLHCEKVKLPDWYHQRLRDKVVQRGFTIGFHSWRRYLNVIQGGGQQQLTVNAKFRCLRSFLNIFVPLVFPRGVGATNGKFTTFPFNVVEVQDAVSGGFNLALTANLLQSQLNFNAVTYPDEPIDFTQAQGFEGYVAYLKWVLRWFGNAFIGLEPAIHSDEFIRDKFIQIYSFDPYPEVKDLCTDFNTLNSLALVIQDFFAGNGPTYTPTVGPTVDIKTNLHTWTEFFIVTVTLISGQVDIVM